MLFIDEVDNVTHDKQNFLTFLTRRLPQRIPAKLVLAARFSHRVRKQSLRRLAGRDADAKAKEILFLKDRVCQLEMQVSILQKHLHKKGKSPGIRLTRDCSSSGISRLFRNVDGKMKKETGSPMVQILSERKYLHLLDLRC